MKSLIKRNPISGRWFYQILFHNGVPAVESFKQFKTESECNEALNKFVEIINIETKPESFNEYNYTKYDGLKVLDEAIILKGADRFHKVSS